MAWGAPRSPASTALDERTSSLAPEVWNETPKPSLSRAASIPGATRCFGCSSRRSTSPHDYTADRAAPQHGNVVHAGLGLYVAVPAATNPTLRQESQLGSTDCVHIRAHDPSWVVLRRRRALATQLHPLQSLFALGFRAHCDLYRQATGSQGETGGGLHSSEMACLNPLELEIDIHPVSEPVNAGRDQTRTRFSQPAPSRTPAKPVQRAPKRMAKQTEPRSQSLASSRMTWRCGLAAVKADFINARYRQCSARCESILSGATRWKDTERLFLIFLHFYAASALELETSSSHHTSPHCLHLLHAARDHYRVAASLIKAEHRDVSKQLLLHALSTSSTIGSPASSVSTDRSPPTSVSSPTNVAYSPWRRSETPSKKPSKHVLFADQVATEPLIRPDSPTLGFDEWLGRSSPELSSQEPLICRPSPQPEMRERPFSVEHLLEYSGTKQSHRQPGGRSSIHDKDVDGSLPRDHSLRRFKTLLVDLQTQLSSHAAHVDAEIAAAGHASPSTVPHGAMRSTELQARIAALKAQGWPLRRFDAQPYEALCDSAMADLME